jgi:hypothetical protein
LANDKRRRWLLAVVIAAPALVLACVLVRERATTYLRESQLPPPLAGLLTGAMSPRDDQPADPADFLPPATTLSRTLKADLDKDGVSETLLVFNAEDTPYEPRAGGVIVLDQGPDGSIDISELRPPSLGKVTDAEIRDINLDGVLELLLYKSSEDEMSHYLYVFVWGGAGWTSLGPDGEEVFFSAYYPPQVRNLDSGDSEEITVFEDRASAERLKAVVYSWDGRHYVRADWIVVLGPTR